MNVLITGANGFLGSALAEKFSTLKFNVSLVVRPNSNLSRLDANLDKYKIFRFTNEFELKTIVNDVSPDIIIHTVCNYGRNNEDILTVYDANFRIGLLLLSEICSQNNKVFFLNIGTVLPSNNSIYSISKNQFSEFGKFISYSFKNITFLNVKMQHMFGPGDEEKKFISFVLNSCLRNDFEVKLSNGEQLRDFIYIEDVTEAIAVICNNMSILSNEDIEIGSGNLISIKEMVIKIHELTKSKTILNFGAINTNGDHSVIPAADLSILKSLKWTPRYNIEEGLIETLKYAIK